MTLRKLTLSEYSTHRLIDGFHIDCLFGQTTTGGWVTLSIWCQYSHYNLRSPHSASVSNLLSVTSDNAGRRENPYSWDCSH